MQELFQKLPKILETENLVLVDTCFFIDVFEKNRQKQFEEFCEEHNTALTTFNVEELIHNIHRIHEKTKDHIRHFIKSSQKISLLEIPVHPGDWQQEKDFVESIDLELLQKVHDPSDAVLMAAAIKHKAVILTKDKHHLFTTTLENFLNKYSLKVYKELKDLA